MIQNNKQSASKMNPDDDFIMKQHFLSSSS